ncbi:MAG: hypothetical protein RLZZ546_1017 [Bacteroidota bacterium]|jgi:iron complex outermembrane receptor protein
MLKSKSSTFFVFLNILLFNCSILFCQRTIFGVVKDASSNEPIIGANIILKSDNSIGTVSDYEGKFELTLPTENETIIISYVGFQSQEISISNQSNIEILLQEGEILENIVVIGYGTVKKEDATGALISVNSKDFNKGAIASPQQLLAGKVAGVSITNSGDPGGGSTIRIRGESSLKGSNDPLIVIDGVPLDNEQISGERNNLNVINPNDIESMTVLKDASATAIYGNRASAGVILITTKKGALGKKINVSYNANYSIGKITKYVDVLDASEFTQAVTTKYSEDSIRLGLLGNDATDWQKQIYQNATGMDHNLSVGGAFGNFPYRISGGFTDMNGLLKTDNFKRYTGGINLNPKFLENRLQINVGAKIMRSNNDFADRGSIGSALSFNPTLNPYDANNKYGGFTSTLDSKGNPIQLAPANPLALLNQIQDESTVNRYITNAQVDYRFSFLPDLRFNLNIAYDHSKGSGFRFIDTVAAFNPLGTNNTYEQTKDNKIIEFYLNYKKNIAKHSLDFMTGYSWQRFGLTSNSISGSIKSRDEKTNPDARELFLLSVYGRTNYDFNDKIYATFTLRADGTSRFAPGKRWGLFPAAALSAKLIENDNSLLNNAKLRISWGLTGQQDVGSNYYAYLGAYEASIQGAGYQFGNTIVNTLRPNGYDEEIKWETTTTLNLGTDISIIRNKLSTSIDVYSRNTKDLLIDNVPLAAGTNLTNVLTTNIGEMKNKGLEITVNTTPISNNNLTWDFNVNMAYNTNEISKLRSTADSTFDGVLVGGIAGGVGSNIQILSVGYQPYSFYVFEQTYDENGKIVENVFADRNNDGLVNQKDKYRLKSRQPNYTFGLSSNLKIKNIDFSFAGRANLGNYMYSNVETDMGWLKRLGNINGALTNVHQSAVDNNVENQSSLTFSDHFLSDASFFRMDHITLGWDLNSLLGKNVRIYTTVQNAFVITKYRGLDPEQFSGIDNQIYPRPRNFVFGLNANF